MNSDHDELRAEYSPNLIRSGAKGKYAERYRQEGSNVALIDPDLHKLFPDSEAVNKALRKQAQREPRSAN